MRLAAICLAASIEGDCDWLGGACEERDNTSLEIVILFDESILYDDRLEKWLLVIRIRKVRERQEERKRNRRRMSLYL